MRNMHKQLHRFTGYSELEGATSIIEASSGSNPDSVDVFFRAFGSKLNTYLVEWLVWNRKENWGKRPQHHLGGYG